MNEVNDTVESTEEMVALIPATDENLRTAQQFDPLDFAERATGNSYKEDEETLNLGVATHLLHGKMKKDLATAADDTSYGTELPTYFRILEEEGFRKVFEVDIDPGEGDEAGDKFFIFWNPEGTLVMFDTYWGGKSMNGGTMYYNWVANEGVDPYKFTCSGGYPGYRDGDTKTHCGSRDIREFFRANLRAMRENGSFLPTWKYADQLWAISYGDQRKINAEHGEYRYGGGVYEKVILDKLTKLPEDVQSAIKVGIDNYKKRLAKSTGA